MDALAKCSVCGLVKPPTDFSIDRRHTSGRSTTCRTCAADRANHHYRRKRREQGAAYTRLIRDDEWAEIEKRGWLICRCCGEKKALEKFRASSRKPRVRRKCRTCDKKRMQELRVLKREERQAYHKRLRCERYGITPEEYDGMLEAQRGLCAICRQPLGPKRQTIDHCHKTGQVRGIVHEHCNLVIGNAREDVDLLRGAIAYLQKHATYEEEKS